MYYFWLLLRTKPIVLTPLTLFVILGVTRVNATYFRVHFDVHTKRPRSVECDERGARFTVCFSRKTAFSSSSASGSAACYRNARARLSRKQVCRKSGGCCDVFTRVVVCVRGVLSRLGSVRVRSLASCRAIWQKSQIYFCRSRFAFAPPRGPSSFRPDRAVRILEEAILPHASRNSKYRSSSFATIDFFPALSHVIDIRMVPWIFQAYYVYRYICIGIYNAFK